MVVRGWYVLWKLSLWYSGYVRGPQLTFISRFHARKKSFSRSKKSFSRSCANFDFNSLLPKSHWKDYFLNLFLLDHKAQSHSYELDLWRFHQFRSILFKRQLISWRKVPSLRLTPAGTKAFPDSFNTVIKERTRLHVFYK